MDNGQVHVTLIFLDRTIEDLQVLEVRIGLGFTLQTQIWSFLKFKMTGYLNKNIVTCHMGIPKDPYPPGQLMPQQSPL